MAFLLNNQPLAVDTPFTANEISYPANWLRLSSAEEKEAIGITEVADIDMNFDNRFYWSKDLPKALEDKEESDEDGNPMFVKELGEVDGKPAMVDTSERLVTKGLKSNFIAQVKQTAGSILSQTDWMVIRKAERDVAIPTATVAYRASVVAKATALEASITACTTVGELANLNLSFPQE
jgi:hypothetical protein